MKKIIAMVLCALLLLSLTACAGGSAGVENVGGVDNAADNDVAETPGKEAPEAGNDMAEVSEEILGMLGMSAEEFAAMDPEKQQAILNEMGVMLEQQEKEEQTQQEAKTYTPEDVMAGGKYKVVLGDHMNSITLYYENGVLVKLVEEFQKSSEEEGEVATIEGAALAEYSFNFVDWDGASLQEILDGMKDYGAFGRYQISKID